MHKTASWTVALGLFLASSAVAQAGGPPPKGAALVIEDFESYASDAALAKAWYKPPHGNWMRQTLVARAAGPGGHALKLEYRSEPGEGQFYAAVCIVKNWNLATFDAVRFWLKPDGSGRELTIQWNVADAKGDNIHDLWQASYRPEKGDTTARLVTIPFARLERPGWLDRSGKRASFEPASVNELALYVGAPDGPHGEGVYEFDDFEAVRIHDELAPRALAAMRARAEELKIEGVAVVAWTEGAALRSWSSRMAVVGAMTKPPAGNDAGANLLGIAYAKASEMAATLVDSGTAARKPLTGEFGWTGGLVRKGESGLLIAAFSGGPSEDDVKVSRAGLDVLAGRTLYGSVVNPDFDYTRYLATISAAGLNHTRLFLGDYVEGQGAFGIVNDTIAPAAGRFLAPWARSREPGFALGGNKFDLDRWAPAYFERLHAFTQEAYARKLVAELNRYDNVFFNLCNEPWFYNQEWPGFVSQPPAAVKEWIGRVSEWVVDAETRLGRRHLLGVDVSNQGTPLAPADLAGVFRNLSVFTCHYDANADSPQLNRGVARAIGAESLPFVRMRPDDALVVGGADGWRALGAPGEAYAVWLPGAGPVEVALALPAGEWRFEWVDILTGEVTAQSARHESWATKVRGERRGGGAALRVFRVGAAGPARDPGTPSP